MLKKPSLAERLPNGLIMVNDDYRNRVVVIDPATDSIVWQYGITDQSGTDPGDALHPRRLRQPAGQRDHAHPPPDRLTSPTRRPSLNGCRGRGQASASGQPRHRGRQRTSGSSSAPESGRIVAVVA